MHVLDMQSLILDAQQVPPQRLHALPSAKRRIVAAIASAFIPGIGQAILRAKKSALAFALGLAILVLLHLPFRVLQWWYISPLLILYAIILVAFSSWHALRADLSPLPKASRWWLLLILPAAVGIGTFYCNLLMIASGFRVYAIPSVSMEPTIMRGDRMMADLRAYRHTPVRQGDLVVVHRQNLYFVKRVAAVEGSMIEGRGGEVFVNNIELVEPYVQHTSGANAPLELTDFGPFLISPGAVFIVGDNRDVSYDSRSFGPIPVSEIVGKPVYSLKFDGESSGRYLK
jgi:signal peptidase I